MRVRLIKSQLTIWPNALTVSRVWNKWLPALQRAELVDLAGRLKRMQQSIDVRDKLADKVVQRRVEDLLNPNLRWDAINASEQMPANGGIVKSESKVAPSLSESNPQSSRLNNRSSLPSSVLPVSNERLIQEAVTRLLASIPHYGSPDGGSADTPIAFVGIYYDGTKEIGDFKERLLQQIENQISQSADCSLVSASKTNESSEVDLSTPQSTLDYIHRYSIDHPGDFPAECYTDEALLELSGMMLQNLSMMSAMSQIALQTGGVIGEKDGVSVVSGVSPAFHIQVEALLKEHMWTTPTESANQAFDLLAKLTFGSKSSNSLVLVDRQ